MKWAICTKDLTCWCRFNHHYSSTAERDSGSAEEWLWQGWHFGSGGRTGYLRILSGSSDDLKCQFEPEQFKEELKKRPRLLICSPEFLGSSEVQQFTKYLQFANTGWNDQSDLPQIRDILLECKLAPAGLRPIVCIDECQVTYGTAAARHFLMKNPNIAQKSTQSCWNRTEIKLEPITVLHHACLFPRFALFSGR